VLRVERDADAGIDGQDELLVALAPVLDDGDVAGRAGRLHHHPCVPFFPHRQCHREVERRNGGRGEKSWARARDRRMVVLRMLRFASSVLRQRDDNDVLRSAGLGRAGQYLGTGLVSA
jgi:hypothetical protein